jgi:hypothetical protein
MSEYTNGTLKIGQPPTASESRTDTLTTQHYRNGMLWKEETMDYDRRMAFISHKKMIEDAAGHDDRFVEIWKWYISGQDEPIVEMVYVHLFHLPGKVLVYSYYDHKHSHLWVYEDDYAYLLGPIEIVEGVGLKIGDPIDDFRVTVPVEVPTATVKRFTRDNFTGGWKETPIKP